MPRETQRTHHVFLSYASPDRDRVLPFHDWLQSSGYPVWMDCRQLLPGQNWNLELLRAIDAAALIVIFLSSNSVQRRGYVQRELKIAMDHLQERLSDDIYLIPILLDDVPLPDHLRGIQAISASDPECKSRIIKSLDLQLSRLDVEASGAKLLDSKLTWKKSLLQEDWDGLPGYQTAIELIEFESAEHSNLYEIGQHIRGLMRDHVFEQRWTKLEQRPDVFTYGTPCESRTSTFEVQCGAPTLTGSVLTVQFGTYYYNAGAAHPNYNFLTFAYLLEPLIRISSLALLFSRPLKNRR